MPSYKLYNSKISGAVVGVIRTDSDTSYTCIPFDTQNVDYVAYLAWLAEGNEPLPADQSE